MNKRKRNVYLESDYYYVLDDETMFTDEQWEKVKKYIKDYHGIDLDSVDKTKLEHIILPRFLDKIESAREELADLEAGAGL